MKILLIQSPLGRREPVIYPAGLAYLAGFLTGHEILAVDPNLSGSFEEVESALETFKPEVVGISLRNIDSQMLRDLALYLPPFLELLQRIRTLKPEVKIVVGGAGFSLFPEEIMARAPAIDVGVFLEGEHTFEELVAGKDPRQVQGVFYRENGAIRFTGVRPFHHFHELRGNAWDIIDPSPYLHSRWAVGVQTKRGCSLHCAYCTYPMLNGRVIRCRSPRDVVDEVELLATKYKVKEFMFIDAVFNNPQAHAEAIVKELLKRNLGMMWTAYFSEKQITSQFAAMAIEAGCREFSFSPDGVSSRTLKALGKNTAPFHVERLFRMLDELPGLRISLGFFINPPDNHFRAFLRLLSLFIRGKLLQPSKVVGFILASPRIEPNTDIERRARMEGLIPKDQSLLPRNEAELKQLFYRNPKTPYAEWAFRAYIELWKVSRWFRTRRLGT